MYVPRKLTEYGLSIILVFVSFGLVAQEEIALE
jgi:hypothetical protein